MANILKAIDKNDVEGLNKLLTKDNINTTVSKRLHTPLTYACQKGLLKVVSSLLEKNADVDKSDGKNYIPLYKAVKSGSMEIVELLVEKNADVNKIQNGGFTAVFAAVEFDRVDMLQFFISKNADLTVVGERGNLVRYAVKNLAVNCLKQLVQTEVIGVDEVNPVHRETGELLFYEVVKLFLARKEEADKAKLIEILLVLHKAGAKINHLSGKKGQEETALHLAAKYVNAPLLEYLLDMDADVDVKTAHEDTPLHYLFYVDKKLDKTSRKQVPIECIQILFKHKADPNIANKSGITPFLYMMKAFIAIFSEDYKILRMFLQQGADVAVRDFAGDTPLHCAAQRGTRKMCELLVKHKADVNAPNDCGETPLHHAVHPIFLNGKIEKVNSPVYLLLENGAKILKNEDGDYPHFLAGSDNLLSHFHAMIEYGCDIDATNNNGDTILHVLAKSAGRNGELVSLLEKNNTGQRFDLFITNGEGKSIWDLTMEGNWSFEHKQRITSFISNDGKQEPKNKKAFSKGPAKSEGSLSSTPSDESQSKDVNKGNTSSTNENKNSNNNNKDEDIKSQPESRKEKEEKAAASALLDSKIKSITPKEVLISYQSDHKEIALKIRDYLLNDDAQIDAWINIEEMPDNDFQRMQRAAIASSKLVVMCLSSKYEEAARAEYEHTSKKGKPFVLVRVEEGFEPTVCDSLDMIIAAGKQKGIHDLSSDEKFKQNEQKMLAEIIGVIRRRTRF